tara:strand:- start:1326 stop:1976 length:651 start_codon:yes stop_codon:yes gene_type:complete
VNIILFGPPGAGKGTQADNIVKNFSLHKISAGDLLRKEIEKKTDLGLKIKSKIDHGMLVSDDIITDLIDNIISKKKSTEGVIFDGYPRNLNQAKILDTLIKKHNRKISCVLSLDVDKKNLKKRILGRIICTKCGMIFNKYFNPPNEKNHDCGLDHLKVRSDDAEKTINNRIEIYTNQTLPILDYYEGQKILHKIDATGEIDKIYDEIRGIITSLET